MDREAPSARADRLRHGLFRGAVAAPLGLCSELGELECATPAALSLLRDLSVIRELPARLPAELWQTLERSRLGDAIAWRPPTLERGLLGCTRYALDGGGFLLLMREVSEKQAELWRGLNRQRIEATGRLVASVAHDVRSSVASIVYSADFLEGRNTSLKQETLREALRDISDASHRLQLTVDGLLDYARIGPVISVPVSLREALNRAQGLLRSFYRDGAHGLRVELSRDADWLRGNPVVIEQIFVNMLLGAAECAEAPGMVTVTSEADGDGVDGTALVRVHVSGHGPVVPEILQEFLLDSLSTQASSVRVALLDAREAAERQGGSLACDVTEAGARFSVCLPRSEGPR